ncbi:acyl-coenzyme A thioesterase THEM4-like [Balearica regulorum gibbericeps]|uniref:acyl-coenzyme A thioesterase THEM4-like n=1 Tax=Balearica regulorum gibbericeps TaxID=100784 RepID=UPI003F6491D7
MWRGGGVVGRALAASCRPRPPARPCPRPPPPPGPEPPRDLALPNGAWSDAMRRQYRRLLDMAATGAWRRLPSYRSARHHLRAGPPPATGTDPPPAPPGPAEAPATPRDTRLFLRAIDGDGDGFEYAMFLNAAERRLLCLFQPGPHLEGHPGLTHGGAIAAIIDGTLGTCALAVAGRVMTANLSIDYLAPVPLGAVLLLDGRAERLEGRKVFLSCHVRSADGDTLHARATGLFIQLDPAKHRAQDGEGGR